MSASPLESRSGATPGAQPMAHRKAQDRAMILPIIGFALLMPPFGTAFELDAKIAGVPFTLIYLFAVWAGLILCGWRLSRVLSDADPGAGGGASRPADANGDAAS